MVRVSKSVTIKRPPEAVYEFWRQLENLPRFMRLRRTQQPHVAETTAV